MARLSTQIYTLKPTPKAQAYFGSDRNYLLAILECPQGISRAEYAPLNAIHRFDIFHVKNLLDNLSEYEINKLLAIDKSLSYSELAIIFKQNWSYPLSYVLSCLFYNLYLPENILNSNIKLSGLVINNFHEVYNFISNNYTCVKLKVGSNLEEEIKNIKALRSNIPKNINLRLDANKRLNLEDASKLVRDLTPEAIEYFEEPLNNSKYLCDFCNNYNIPIALDESFSETSTWEEIESTKATYLIIKPSRFSSIYWVMACAQEALKRNIKPILSTCFESSYSTALYALMAAELNILDYAHGIWAEGFFSNESPFVNSPGYISLSEALSYIKKQ